VTGPGRPAHRFADLPSRLRVAGGGDALMASAARRRRSILRLAGVAISVGLADSLNPSTVDPALYLTGRTGEVGLIGRWDIGRSPDATSEFRRYG